MVKGGERGSDVCVTVSASICAFTTASRRARKSCVLSVGIVPAAVGESARRRRRASSWHLGTASGKAECFVNVVNQTGKPGRSPAPERTRRSCR